MRITLQANSINENEFMEIIGFINAYIIGQGVHSLDYKYSLDEILVAKGKGSRGTDVKYYIADFWLHEGRYSKFDREFFIYFFSHVLKFNRLQLNLFIMNANFETIFREETSSRKILQVQLYE